MLWQIYKLYSYLILYTFMFMIFLINKLSSNHNHKTNISICMLDLNERLVKSLWLLNFALNVLLQKPEFKMSEEIPRGSAGRGEECGTSGRAEKEKKERRYQSASWGLASAGGGGKLNHIICSRYKFMVIFEVLCFNSVFFPSPVHQALVDLQLQTGVQVRFLSTWKDFTDYITMSTKAVAEAPFKWVGSQFPYLSLSNQLHL